MSKVLELIRPTQNQRVYDLVREAGVDVSDWANVKGGEAKAAANPKYCYEWSFSEPGKIVVLNLWHAELITSGETALGRYNLLERAKSERNSTQRRRAIRMNEHIKEAYYTPLPVRVIVLDGPRRAHDANVKVTRAKKRLLDPEHWAITDYDAVSGQCTALRGAKPEGPAVGSGVDEELSWFEGQQRRQFVVHRRRERKHRQEKINAVRQANGGRLACEVPSCGFAFADRYGQLGADYAQVHHLKPLSDAPDDGMRVSLDDLAVVCANCHVMIHLGGKCRALHELISST